MVLLHKMAALHLIDKYAPYDYRDAFTREIDPQTEFNVDLLFERMFCDFPKPVRWLLGLRNMVMKPFGIKGGISFKDLVIERNDEEIVLFKADKHLDFWVGLMCSEASTEKRTASVTTVVRFNNTLGKVYFVGIWLFHKLIAGSMLRRAVR